MMKQFARYFHVHSPLWASVNKSDLAKLRKKTGYTFANCKKALEVNNNDLSLAEKWLKEQAQTMGWQKATKLEGRATLQGLIGLALKANSGVLCEINCETDFVARNKTFKSLVELSTNSCLKETVDSSTSQSITKVLLNNTDLKALAAPDGKSLADHTALSISSVGENISLRRAITVKTPSDIFLAGYTHPKPDNASAKVLIGKYGALVAYKTDTNDERAQQIAKQLCQHIVGMNPSKVGVVDEDEPVENTDEETVMINQEFLLDPSVTVRQLIEDAKIQVLDFIRIECGEPERETESQVQVKASQRA